MRTGTGNRIGFERRLKSIGKTLADARPYIVGPIDAARLTFNIDHPDYPHKDKLPGLLRAAGQAAKTRITGPQRWAEAIAYVQSHGFNPKSFRAYAAKMADGLEDGCSCRSHWKKDIAADPPDGADPLGWILRRMNAIAVRKGKSVVTMEQMLARFAPTP